MKKSADISTAQAVEIIELLSSTFSVPAPSLERTKGPISRYNQFKRTIEFGRRASDHPMGGTDSVLHEFAHHLDWELHRDDLIAAWKRPTRFDHHGRRFQTLLMRVVSAWYGDPLKYCWTHEYASVRKFGTRKETR